LAQRSHEAVEKALDLVDSIVELPMHVGLQVAEVASKKELIL